MVTSSAALLNLGGTLRACSAEQTLAWIRPLFPAFGLTRLARVTGLDTIGVHVSVAVRPLSRSLSVSQGKGVSAELADTSAAMQSIELCMPKIPSPRRRRHLLASGRAPRGGRPLRAPAWPLPGGPDLRETPAGWYRGHDLITEREVLVPDYVIDMRADQPRPEWARVVCSSNGLASGNTREEAICHALFEVIERDGAARLEQHPDRARSSRIDIASVDGPARSIVEKLLQARIRFCVYDAMSAAGVPSFVCHLRGDGELRGLATFLGQGCHLSKDIALLRALSEAVQSRVTLIAGSRDDISSLSYAEMRRSAHQALSFSGSASARRFASVPSPEIPKSFSQIAADLTLRLQRLGAKHAVVVDLSKPELGVPVVFVQVPGLQQLLH